MLDAWCWNCDGCYGVEFRTLTDEKIGSRSELRLQTATSLNNRQSIALVGDIISLDEKRHKLQIG